MIPPFDETGVLPSGIHPATLAEIAVHFGSASELRRVQMESIGWMVDIARRAGVARIVLNGSFATDKIEPNDVDCVLLFVAGEPRDRTAMSELREGLPFLDMKLVGQEDFDEFVNVIFGTDRAGVAKGVVEVIFMTLRNETERAQTQTKLARLVKRREALAAEVSGDAELRQMTLESLQAMILQLQEDIARYDASHRVRGEPVRT
jgi:hypothetical protein